eukprot:4461532-Alexandrium_andersonii.AAC.1
MVAKQASPRHARTYRRPRPGPRSPSAGSQGPGRPEARTRWTAEGPCKAVDCRRGPAGRQTVQLGAPP